MNQSISKFDASRIVFSFGVLSDWHIRADFSAGPDNRAKLTTAISQLRERAERDDPNGLALLVAAGDLTHDGKPEEIALLRETMDGVMSWEKTAFIYVAGNHDKHDPNCNATYHEIFGAVTDERYEAQDAAPDGFLSGNCHYTVGGRHFITLDPGKYHKQEPNVFTASTKEWLEATLAEITAHEPHAYVYIITHLPMQDTCYGSSRGYFYATDDVSDILRRYPQVLTFGGHLHYPLNDERAIMQGAFTAVETATLSDMLIDGFDCGNVKKTKIPGDRSLAQGLLVQEDAEGNLRLTRMDFLARAEIGQAWEVDAPAEDGSHLRSYTEARRAAAGEISFGGEIAAEFGESEEGVSFLKLALDAARCEGVVRKYEVTLTPTDGGEARIYGHLTDFYRYPQSADMPRRVEIVIPEVAVGQYGVSVKALDCWGNESRPLTAVIAP